MISGSSAVIPAISLSSKPFNVCISTSKTLPLWNVELDRNVSHAKGSLSIESFRLAPVSLTETLSPPAPAKRSITEMLIVPPPSYL